MKTFEVEFEYGERTITVNTTSITSLVDTLENDEQITSIKDAT